jgi:hypothetical protein
MDLRSDVYRESALRAVGLRDFWPANGTCEAPACANRRPEPPPMTPGHARTCRNFHTARHDFIANVFLRLAFEAGVGPCTREDGSAFGVVGSRSAPAGRADVLVRHSTALATGDAVLDSKHWIVDVGFGDPAVTTERARWRACDRAGYVAANVEVTKHYHYRTPGTAQVRALAARAVGAGAAGAAVPLAPVVWPVAGCPYAHATHVLVPFAVETHGCLGQDAIRLLWALATHASGGPDGNVRERGRLFTRFRLLMSLAVTRAVSVQAVSHPNFLREQNALRASLSPVLARSPVGPVAGGVVV